MKLNRKFYAKFLLISIIVCLISIFGTALIDTNFGSVITKDIKIVDSLGHDIGLTIYQPKTATPENPAPCVITLHGSYNGRESQNFISLELAKRGFVAITMDCDGHGDASNWKENPMDAFFLVTANPGSSFEEITTAPTSGMADVVEFVYHNLAIVDKSQIGIQGHSLGGKTADACYAYYKIQEYLGKPNKIAAVFLMGNQQLAVKGNWLPYLNYDPDDVLESGDEIHLPYDVHYGVSAGAFDENNYTTEAGGPWTFPNSNNARVFINELDNYNLAETESVEVGKIYKGTVNGSEQEYIRALYQPKEIHMVNPYSPASTRNSLDFFQNAFTAPNPIAAGSMTGQYSMILSVLGMIGFFCAVFSSCCLMLTSNYFSSLLVKSPEDVYMPQAPQTAFTKFLYWGFMAAGAFIPITYMMKLAMWIGGHKGETFAARSLFGTRIWPQGLLLEQALWSASAGLLTVGIFFLRYFLSNGPKLMPPSQWNMKIDKKNIWKTILLAVCSVGVGYAIVGFGHFFFGLEFRLGNYVIRWPAKEPFLISFRFMILYGLFFFSNAFTQNIGRMVKGRKEWLNVLLMCVANSIGLFCLWIYQYYTFSQVGKVPLNSARVMQTWSLFIVQTVCTIIARRLYLKTGKIYLGALINTIMFAMISCCHTMTLNVTNWWF
ncbi:alpha/beta fold hydrolase [Enterocloster lavalensis]|uniref:alpha/beta fold hydrolase n=1 Tax=Enterocloster lavalensis TaxID=460384 RepID=UPI001D08FEF9|nr:alpha/beta hydrolase [Enterocloster lavalensis]MCB6343358.1 alpha/beta hydrolase [Enterocloster lavalensis]